MASRTAPRSPYRSGSAGPSARRGHPDTAARYDFTRPDDPDPYDDEDDDLPATYGERVRQYRAGVAQYTRQGVTSHGVR